MPNQIEDSRKNWASDTSIEHINSGCLQRIANATEAMAKNHINTQERLDYYMNRCKELWAHIEKLKRSNNALRGHINRMKKQSK